MTDENRANSIAEQVTIVTGAAKGIGQAIATRFGAENAKVVVADVDGHGAEATVGAIRAAGGTAIAVDTDIADEQQVQDLVGRTVAEFGRVDTLVNNAGLISPTLHVLKADKAWWDRFIDVNLTGTFLCSLAAAKLMAKQGSGSIINLSSGGATRAHRCFVSYDAAKGGIEAMTRAMALDLGPYGVRVNYLVPGAIDTTGIDEEGRKLRGANVPLCRVGEPKDLTGAAVFLASNDARYVTGQSIVVDGGMLAQQRSATVDIEPPADFPSLDEIS